MQSNQVILASSDFEFESTKQRALQGQTQKILIFMYAFIVGAEKYYGITSRVLKIAQKTWGSRFQF